MVMVNEFYPCVSIPLNNMHIDSLEIALLYLENTGQCIASATASYVNGLVTVSASIEPDHQSEEGPEPKGVLLHFNPHLRS